MIDRFDARSHLDLIEEYTDRASNQERHVLSNAIDEERMCNYERYKTFKMKRLILARNIV